MAHICFCLSKAARQAPVRLLTVCGSRRTTRQQMLVIDRSGVDLQPYLQSANPALCRPAWPRCQHEWSSYVEV